MADARQLLQAIQAGDDDEVEVLFDADPTLASAVDENGVSALLHALYRGRRDLAERCIAAGHPPSLHECVCLGLEAQVRERLGADPAVVVSWSPDGFLPLHLAQAGGYTPLMSAAGTGNVAMIEALLHAGADPALTTDDGRTAAALARERDHEEVLPFLRGTAE